MLKKAPSPFSIATRIRRFISSAQTQKVRRFPQEKCQRSFSKRSGASALNCDPCDLMNQTNYCSGKVRKLTISIRSPLTAILGWSHLLRSNKLNENEAERAIETIERNAKSQSQLIDDLLDVSRIITGKLQIDSALVDLANVIEAAHDAMRPAAEAKEIRFEISIEPAKSAVVGDQNRLQQVFWNLFSNAVKFSRRGGKVRITAAVENRTVRVSVADDGIGINEEFLPFIFDR